MLSLEVNRMSKPKIKITEKELREVIKNNLSPKLNQQLSAFKPYLDTVRKEQEVIKNNLSPKLNQQLSQHNRG
jgi:hypothetical protein